MSKVEAVIYRHSEFEKLRSRINELRFAAETRKYEVDLNAYHRRRCERTEVQREVKDDIFIFKKTGFVIKRMGRTEFVSRPEKPGWIIWTRDKNLSGDFRELGLIAGGGRYNRPVSHKRVKDYSDTMLRGEWRDNWIDPLAITADGEIINGQHRLAAMSKVGLEPGDKDAQFLVLFGVPACQVTLSDISRRSAKDFTVIAGKAAASAAARDCKNRPSQA